jgi:hypothetical protein
LDTAKRWLNDPTLTKTDKQAIIFLSDGAPSDSYLNLVADGNMPPIYGIFLGNPSADYSKLQQLADTTGGAFYLIPPNRPDSLVTVVKSILNLILKNFDPVSATLQNASLVPSQTSSSSAFVRQSDNVSWRLQLDSAIGLREGLNRMTLTSTFRDSSSGESDIRNTEFWLKVDQSSVSGDGLKPDSSFGWTCYEASRLRILTA